MVNCSGIHPQVLKAIEKANEGYARSYGADEWTTKAKQVFRSHFGDDAQVAFVFNGTAANVLSPQSINRPYNATFCSESAQVDEDECGASEKHLGSKLIGVPHLNGKITIDAIKAHLKGVGDQHHVQPKAISISQSTEFGTVYQLSEVKALAKFARENGVCLHMDGARVSNAAAHLGLGFRPKAGDAACL